MPELPEIESLRLKLIPKLKGSCIERMVFRRADLRYPLPVKEAKKIAGQKILGLRRRSKYLLIDLSDGSTMVLHLGMSGRFFFAAPDLVLDCHDHVILELSGKRQMRLRDPRRFGMLFICKTSELSLNRFFKNLGQEPLEEGFSGEFLFQLCRAKKTPIKSLLMDASKIVGIGNIYANEALFLSGIRPTRRAAKISQIEAISLCANIKKILKASIEAGGTSFRDYVDAEQKPGLHQLDLFVYGRGGDSCRKCQTPIKRLVQANRSSFYCPSCQK